MAKGRQCNLSDLINEYDNDEFLQSITLKNVTSTKELKSLYSKLENANKVVTSYYETLYSDYLTMINSECQCNECVDLDTLKHYKNLASKIQKAYSYIMYLTMLDNPFKTTKTLN